MPPSAFLRLDGVMFAYDSATRPMFSGLDLAFPHGWTGVVGRNGSGKTTLLRLAIGELKPGEGRVERRGETALCEQDTSQPPPAAVEFLAAGDPESYRIRGRLEIEPDWLDRFETLSHGERKLLQIGAALYRQPDILVVDEPTNHLDGERRGLVQTALRAFRGIGLIVSHDRDLLDAICSACLFLDGGGPLLRPGGYTRGKDDEARSRLDAERAHERASRKLSSIEREAGRRRDAAARSKRRLSKRGLNPKDHDAREKIDRAKVSGKDTAAGRRLRQLDGRRQQAADQLSESARPAGENLGFTWKGARSHRNVLLRLDPGHLHLGGTRRLSFPALEFSGTDRIALRGQNGAGKSSLLAHVIDSLPIPGESVIVLPQEVSPDRARAIVAEARALPKSELGEVLSTVQRLGSDPRRLLETDLPSAGELRKLLFALGSRHDPELIVMDEPTNHLDLASVECLEEALSAYSGALLLVSHDRRFLEALTSIDWRIDVSGQLTVRLSRGG